MEKLKEKEYNHYMAVIRKGNLYIGTNISNPTAISRLESGGDVWLKTPNLAAIVAREAGGGRPPTPSENHFQSGSRTELYYSDYHTYNRTGGHSFYGTGIRGRL